MLHRNLLAMDAEELLRGHPVDGAVLMGGCDKATPALLLARLPFFSQRFWRDRAVRLSEAIEIAEVATVISMIF